ncbi:MULTISPECIES: lactonase family protein [unclassified Microbacterium]|uniref:lactonase family protein n=1 Tax=unclassified Microbacterium TaxID=2609290 RepID=UPI00214B46EE|nr:MULTISPECIES: lactonase family protein [unclassified Microbacterium]MCR2783011.1 lactonase family protein [Microbacterium sp. zg.B96]WIM16103.1 lactonase family protein [Microbacterium sp. zg-B96]
MRFLLGGYTADMGGTAEGIGVLRAGEADAASAGGPLAYEGDAATAGGSPSWLTWHPSRDVVYAALEGDGTVQAFRRTGTMSLARLGGPVAVGEAPCHIAVAPDGGSLIASCWGDGRVVRVRLDAEGRPGPTAAAAGARDPHAEEGPDAWGPAAIGSTGAVDLGARGEESDGRLLDLAAAARALREAAGDEFAHLVPEYDSPPAPAEPTPVAAPDEEASVARASHAHQTVYLPGGVVAATDMGFDLVRFWRAGDGGMRSLPAVVLPRGSGPRHMVWHPSGHLYVVTEASRELFVLAPDATGLWRIVAGTPLGAGTLAGDTAAEICLSRDAEFVYAGVRGSNTLAVLRVRGDGSEVAPVALAEAGVDGPRHHLVVRDTLLVAGQHSGEVAALTLDIRTGVPGGVRARTAAPSPTCILPLRSSRA